MGADINFDDILKKARESEKNGDFKSEEGLNGFVKKSLTPEKAEVLKSVLSDEKRVKAILESDAARELFKKLSGGNGNG